MSIVFVIFVLHGIDQMVQRLSKMVAVEHTPAALYDKENKKNAVQKTNKDQAVKCKNKEAAGIDFYFSFASFLAFSFLFSTLFINGSPWAAAKTRGWHARKIVLKRLRMMVKLRHICIVYFVLKIDIRLPN